MNDPADLLSTDHMGEAELEVWEQLLANREARQKNPLPLDEMDGTCACHPEGCCEASALLCKGCYA